ncbi:uncharacterized protein STEHIDRAFT_162824 [Stereum hirsutum FP-91666 SS1]|uniref:Uncharacterized protein n=1 Tax=Stereum hirsutum (strain FP-91666) TaxID=721885 RepID=R7RZY3_STEHR|nr:uncharacterized protein STEHIDRAFT_162824 [Stereum hirsutum FP-91666 SS1]EIM80408.1 hypothetical protein STEHIDRAFT_162824 [Stereum hirsutum FP-91666 SS1]
MTDVNYDAIRALLQSKSILTTCTSVATKNSHNKWDPLNDGFQEFCAHWYGRTFEFDQKPPYTLDLGLESTHGNEPVICLYEAFYTDFGGGEILVTEEYINMYYQILDRATGSSYGRGVLITGQPGVGKSMFEKFMLARLLSERQVVLYLLESRSEAYLFYHN